MTLCRFQCAVAEVPVCALLHIINPLYIIIIIRPHRSTTYVDAAISTDRVPVCLSVCHTSEYCKNGWTDRDADWVQDSGGVQETMY